MSSHGAIGGREAHDQVASWTDRWTPTSALKPEGAVVVDVHSHLLVPASAAVAAPQAKPENDPRSLHSTPETLAFNKAYFDLVNDRFTNPEPRLADMNMMGIDLQVISLAPPQYFYWLDGDLAPRVAATQNDRIAEVVASHPDRFAGLGTLPLRHPVAAVAEAERIASDHGFGGIEIGSDVAGVDLDDRSFDPIWAKLEDLEMVVMLHPAGFTEARRFSEYYLVNVMGIPLSSTLAVSRMILGGVLERHPALKLLVCHGGGYLPFYFARTDHAYKHRPELRRHISRPPSEYLNRLYFDSMVFSAAMVSYLVDRFGSEHVLLGTDYPFDMGEGDPLALISASGLTDSDLRMVLGGNALQLLRINVEAGTSR